jgi:Pilus formation protein N terminal region
LHFIHQFAVNLSKQNGRRYRGALLRVGVENAMSALLRRPRVFGLWALALLAAGAIEVLPAQADSVSISVDQAHILRLPERVATIVIGNPLIADATLQSGGVLVVTGKGYGATNLLALDRAGRIVMDQTVHVLAPAAIDLVTVYKGVERETYSCAPDCERRITLGDSPAYFNATLTQSTTRNGQAQAAPR